MTELATTLPGMTTELAMLAAELLDTTAAVGAARDFWDGRLVRIEPSGCAGLSIWPLLDVRTSIDYEVAFNGCSSVSGSFLGLGLDSRSMYASCLAGSTGGF